MILSKMMNTILTIIQAILSIIVIILILLQQKGAGLSDSIAGKVSSFSSRRGSEKYIYIATIVFIVLFAGVSIARILI